MRLVNHLAHKDMRKYLKLSLLMFLYWHSLKESGPKSHRWAWRLGSYSTRTLITICLHLMKSIPPTFELMKYYTEMFNNISRQGLCANGPVLASRDGAILRFA